MAEEQYPEEKTGFREKIGRFVSPLRLGRYPKEVRVQMIIMISLTGALCLLSAYVFHFQ